MVWFEYLFFATILFFFLKTVISFICGDMDIDIDTDGDPDFDVSGLISFKGILHLLIGFSTYLSGYKLVSHQMPSVFEYCIAVLVGILFTVILYLAYKIVIKFNNVPTKPNFVRGVGTIVQMLDDNKYVVRLGAYPTFGTEDYVVSSEKKYKVTDEVIVEMLDGHMQIV